MTIAPSAAGTELSQWTVLRGPAEEKTIREVVDAVADRHGLIAQHADARHVLLEGPGNHPVAAVRWRPLPPQRPRTMGFQLPAPQMFEICVVHGADGPVTADLHERLDAATLALAPAEVDVIVESMPLVRRYSTASSALEGWSLLFRDHFVEHSIGFVLGMERAGIPAEWIYTLDKGDQTFNRDRVRATFAARGYRTDLMDNSAVNDPEAHARELERVGAGIDAFIDAAHTEGRRVLIVDDGGLLARGYGSTQAACRADAAIELTVSGMKRIAAAGGIGVPVLNMARSEVKTLLGYPEIADSCMRRLRSILADRKFIGRHVLLIGYGTLGARLAPALRTLGCHVDVVDTDLPVLITAAEAGYGTYRTVAEALEATSPFLVIGTTGEEAITGQDLPLLPDGAFLAPFATRDFSVLFQGPTSAEATEIPGVGIRFPLGEGRAVTLLGNGRSMNLFEAPCIPNQGYDAYLAGTLIVAQHLCADPGRYSPGLHTGPADEVVRRSGLFEAYYELYLAQHRPGSPGLGALDPELDPREARSPAWI